MEAIDLTLSDSEAEQEKCDAPSSPDTRLAAGTLDGRCSESDGAAHDGSGQARPDLGPARGIEAQPAPSDARGRPKRGLERSARSSKRTKRAKRAAAPRAQVGGGLPAEAETLVSEKMCKSRADPDR